MAVTLQQLLHVVANISDSMFVYCTLLLLFNDYAILCLHAEYKQILLSRALLLMYNLAITPAYNSVHWS